METQRGEIGSNRSGSIDVADEGARIDRRAITRLFEQLSQEIRYFRVYSSGNIKWKTMFNQTKLFHTHCHLL